MNTSSSVSQKRDIVYHIGRIFSSLESNKEGTTIDDDDASQGISNTAEFLEAYLNIAHGEYEADEEDESPGEWTTV